MQNFLLLTRKALNQRHRLSHQQIDDLLNEQCAKEHLSEKHDQMFQVSEFIKLSDAFREATVPFIPLKGPILSYRLHKDACYRYSSDLDFLIPLNAVKKAIFILKKNGYQPDGFSWPDNLNKERRVIKLTNQVSFVHPKKQITIEIHWKLFKLEITSSKILDEVLKSNSIQLRFHERKFQGFNNELELLYLIIHGGLHACFRLKWLIDVKDFMEKIPIDTEKFTQLVLQCHASRMVSLCNAMLANYFPECPVLPCKPIRNTKKQLKFAISQIEKEDFYNRSFLEKIKIYWFTMQCFSGFRFKLSVFYSRYLNSFEFHRTS